MASCFESAPGKCGGLVTLGMVVLLARVQFRELCHPRVLLEAAEGSAEVRHGVLRMAHAIRSKRGERVPGAPRNVLWLSQNGSELPKSCPELHSQELSGLSLNRDVLHLSCAVLSYEPPPSFWVLSPVLSSEPAPTATPTVLSSDPLPHSYPYRSEF